MTNWTDLTNEEAERKCLDVVITRIDEIDGPAGIIAAQNIVDTVLLYYAPHIYNKALGDCKKLVEERIYDMQTDIDMLEKTSEKSN